MAKYNIFLNCKPLEIPVLPTQNDAKHSDSTEGCQEYNRPNTKRGSFRDSANKVFHLWMKTKIVDSSSTPSKSFLKAEMTRQEDVLLTQHFKLITHFF